MLSEAFVWKLCCRCSPYIVHHPHKYIKLYFSESLGCLEYEIDRYHWKFRDESGVLGEIMS